jgi:hypothetical protein
MLQPRFDRNYFYLARYEGGCGAIGEYPVITFLALPGNPAVGALVLPVGELAKERGGAKFIDIGGVPTATGDVHPGHYSPPRGMMISSRSFQCL